MHVEAFKKDWKFEKIEIEKLEKSIKRSMFKRLTKYNTPKINVVLGIIISILHGSLMPVFGALMSKMLFVLMNLTNDLNDVRYDSNLWCGLMLTLSLASFITGFS